VPQLRIHFTDADVARTRLKLGVDLMWEIVSSVQILQHKQGDLSIHNWRRHVHKNMNRDSGLHTAVHTLKTVAPHAAYFPDFLTPPTEVCDFETSVEMVLATSPHRLDNEVRPLRPVTGSAAWLDELARGKAPALRDLRQALHLYFKSLIEPYLHVIDDGSRIDRADRIQGYLRSGPEGLLESIGPWARWQPPVLTVDYPCDRDLHLDGRGLLLIPAYFCLERPVALADPQLPPVLVFPVRAASRLLASGDNSGDAVSALLGATRATILRAVVHGSSTSRLAKLAGVSPATVSHHTNVLRDSRLITTNRHAKSATHHITPLGLQLLASGGIAKA
jgi:DNA-binding transcriptional ArsR family regulator